MTSTCPARSGTSSSTNSDSSNHSKSTVPTIYSDRPLKCLHPSPNDNPDPKDSQSTYASTSLSSLDDIPEETTCYDVVDRNTDIIPTDVVPSNHRTFGDIFPSSRRLLIRHDDATLDGNMNLRIDTMVTRRGGYQTDFILFHLRMYDLYSRRFSLRRYCRDSGREVCHSIRKSTASDRKALFSWGGLFGRFSSPDLENGTDNSPKSFSDTIAFEFSNYAHVELKRRTSKRYEYEYWSTRYQWRRESHKQGDLREVSYYLVNMQTSKSIAHILPEVRTPVEIIDEKSKGGWVPPASMWISDASIYETMPDIAE